MWYVEGQRPYRIGKTHNNTNITWVSWYIRKKETYYALCINMAIRECGIQIFKYCWENIINFTGFQSSSKVSKNCNNINPKIYWKITRRKIYFYRSIFTQLRMATHADPRWPATGAAPWLLPRGGVDTKAKLLCS